MFSQFSTLIEEYSDFGMGLHLIKHKHCINNIIIKILYFFTRIQIFINLIQDFLRINL